MAGFVRKITSMAALAALGLAGCNFGAGGGPTATPTLSSADVLKTAQAMAQATRQAASPTATVLPVTETETPIAMTDTPAPTASPSSPTVTANYNAYIRTGPDESYDYIDFLLEGASAQVLGRYDNPSSGTWWYVAPIEKGLDGWVWGGAVSFAGAQSDVPYRQPPPTPTKPPKPTKTPQNTATVAPTTTDTPTP